VQVVNYTEFRKNLKSVLDKTIDNHEVVIVSRSNDNDVVLISLKQYNSWMETLFLLRSERNRSRLLESMANIEKGNIQAHDLIEE